jgi:shikimate kinase
MKSLSNIVLTGMPAVGKSTVGRILAETLAHSYMDTDAYIKEREKRDLDAIIATEGLDGFCRKEEEHVLAIRPENTVIATGGSVVYGERAMAHLKSIGVVIYLRSDLDLILSRLGDPEKRGVVRKKGQSFLALFEERDILYRRYADLIVDCPDGDAPHTTAARVLALLNY